MTVVYIVGRNLGEYCSSYLTVGNTKGETDGCFYQPSSLRDKGL